MTTMIGRMGVRRWLALTGAGAAAVLAAAAGLAAGSGGRVPGLGTYGVAHTYPAGLNPDSGSDFPALTLPDGADNQNNNVGDFLRYAQEAQALPMTDASLSWVSRGPFGVDMPPGFSQSVERFARVTGMGAAVASPVGQPNTVYIGDMGGLWRSTDAGAHWVNLVDGKLPRIAVGAIALDPAHPNDIYIGTGISYLTLSGDADGTGIYVSHDGGASWTRPPQSTQGYGSNAIAVTPTAVFYATNRGLFRLDKAQPAAGFVAVPLPTNAAGTAPASGVVANWVSDVVVKPGSPNEVTAAVGFALGKFMLPDGTVASPGNGLYRSTDGGLHFTRMASTSQLTQPAASSDPVGRIELAYGQAPGQQDVLWAAVSDAGLAAGQAPGGLDLVQATTGLGLNKTNTTFNGLYRSGDDGASWTVKATPQSLETSPNSTLALLGPLGYGIGVQGFYNLWVATDPKVADQVYLGLEEVFQSTANAGATPGPAAFTTIERYADICGFFLYFQNITDGAACPNQTPILGGMSTHPDQHTAIVVPTSTGSRIYSGNDGGFFRQDSHALATNPLQTGFDNQNWTALNTLSTTEPWHVALKPDGEALVALQDNGSALVTNAGNGIEICGGDGVYVLPTPNPDVWYCDTPGAVVYFTTDHGKTITAIPPGPVGASGMNGATFTSPIAIDPTDPNHIVAAGNEIDETTKGTSTQVLYDSAVTGTIVKTDWVSPYSAGNSPVINPATKTPFAWSATALAVRGADIYDAVCGACRGAFTNPKLLRATIVTNVKAGCTAKMESSACWHVALGRGLPGGWISKIAVDPTDPRTIYVSVGEENLFEYDPRATGSARVLVSHDGGDTFTDITGNLPRTSARAVVIRGNQLIVATDVGVFADTIGDGHWSRLGSGLPTGAVTRDLYIDPSGKHLLVSVYGRGAWELTFSTAASSTSTSTAPTKTGTSGRSTAASASGALAATGEPLGVAAAALVLVGVGLGLTRGRRRRRRAG